MSYFLLPFLFAMLCLAVAMPMTETMYKKFNTLQYSSDIIHDSDTT